MKLINKIKLIVLFAVMLVASLCIAACSGGKTTVELPEYPSKLEEKANTYTDLHDNTVVTVDGTITTAEWASQNKWEETLSINGYEHHIEIWSRFAEEGVLMAYRVTGAPAFYDVGRGDYCNSGIEIYIARGDATTAAGNQWEMEFFGNGNYHTSRFNHSNAQNNYSSCNSYVDVAGRWLDQSGNSTYINNPDNNGYENEVMIPWSTLGGKSDSIVFNAAIQFMTSATETTRSGYINILESIEGNSYWTTCQNWRRFDKDGYYDKSKGEFSITPYDVGVEVYNDGYAFTSKGWNEGPSALYYNKPVEESEYILSAKFYAPHLTFEEGSDEWNENYANETNYLPQGQGGIETAYNGIAGTKNGIKGFELAFQKGWGTDGVFFRWNGAAFGWTNVKLTEAQLKKYMTVGLKAGVYVQGNVLTPLLENDEGDLVMLTGAMVKTISGWEDEGASTLRFYYQCASKFDQWNVYSGNELESSLTVIDETAADGHGFITASGKMYDTVTVNVTPEEGYELASLLIGGVEYAARVENNVVTVNVTGTEVTVKATFRQTINQTVTFNVTRKFAYEKASYSVSEAEIILTDNEGNTYTGLVKDGQVTIKVLDGTYTLTANGYANSDTITISEGKAYASDVVLVRKMFNDVTGTVTAVFTGDGTSTTGATLQTTEKANVNESLDGKQWKLEKNIDFSGKVVLIYTLGMGSERECYATIETNRSFNTINQGHWNDTTGYYDAPNNGWTVGVKHSEPTTFMAIFEGQSIKLYYKVNGVWTLLANFDDKYEGELTALTFTTGQHSAIITWSDIKVYDGERAEEILKNTATLAYDETYVTATISKTSGIEKGEEVTVTASVKDADAYQIASVTVNGTVIEAGDDGTYKFTATGINGEYAVVVTYETTAKEITFDVTHKFAYEDNYYNLPDGTEVEFVNGDIVKKGNIANGKVTVALSDGEYTVKYSSATANLTVTVESGAAGSTSLQFMRAIVKESSNVTATYNETGLSYTNPGAANLTVAAVDMTNNVLVFDIRATYAGTTSWSDLFVEPYNSDGSVSSVYTYPNDETVTEGAGYRVDWNPNYGGYATQFQVGGSKNGNFPVKTTKYWTTVLLRTVITEGTAKTDVYIVNYDGTYSGIGHLVKDNADASAMDYKFNHGGENEVKNIKVYDGERATAYFNDLTMVEGTTVTKDGITLTSTRYADLSKYESDKSITVYGIGGNGTGAKESFTVSSANGNVVAMTYNVQIPDKTYVGTSDTDGAWLTFDKAGGAEIVHEMDGYIGYRFRAGNRSTQKFADDKIYGDGGVKFALYLADNTGHYLTEGSDGLMFDSKSITYDSDVPTAIRGIRSVLAIKLTDVTFYTQEQWNSYVTETANTNTTISESENGSASVAYALNGTTTVTVTPGEGFILDVLKVNGADVTASVSGNVYTLANYSKLGIKVEATFKAKPTTEFTFGVTYKFAYEKEYYAVKDGTVLAFTSDSDTYTGTVSEGKVKVALNDGTYTVSGDHIKSFALTVTDTETAATFEAQRLTLVATDESKMTITEDENGASVTFTEKTFGSAYAMLPTISGKTVIKGTYVGAGAWDDSISFMDGTTKRGYLLNIGTWSTNVYFKWKNSNDYNICKTIANYKSSTDSLYHVKFAVVVDGTGITAWTSFMTADGTWEAYESKTFTVDFSFSSFGFASGGTAAFSFNNITVSAITGDYNPNN